MKVEFKQKGYWESILTLSMYWAFFGLLSRFHGAIFMVVSAILGGIIIARTIKEFYWKKKS